MSGSGKINRLSRQKSIMIVESNPLEDLQKRKDSLIISEIKVQNINHSTLLSDEELCSMLKKAETFQ
jgi:hypothetical protein